MTKSVAYSIVVFADIELKSFLWFIKALNYQDASFKHINIFILTRNQQIVEACGNLSLQLDFRICFAEQIAIVDKLSSLPFEKLGTYCFFIDANWVPHRNWLKNYLAGLDNSQDFFTVFIGENKHLTENHFNYLMQGEIYLDAKERKQQQKAYNHWLQFSFRNVCLPTSGLKILIDQLPELASHGLLGQYGGFILKNSGFAFERVNAYCFYPLPISLGEVLGNIQRNLEFVPFYLKKDPVFAKIWLLTQQKIVSHSVDIHNIDAVMQQSKSVLESLSAVYFIGAFLDDLEEPRFQNFMQSYLNYQICCLLRVLDNGEFSFLEKFYANEESYAKPEFEQKVSFCSNDISVLFSRFQPLFNRKHEAVGSILSSDNSVKVIPEFLKKYKLETTKDYTSEMRSLDWLIWCLNRSEAYHFQELSEYIDRSMNIGGFLFVCCKNPSFLASVCATILKNLPYVTVVKGQTKFVHVLIKSASYVDPPFRTLK